MSLKNQDFPKIGLNAHLLGQEGTYRGAGIHSYILHLLRHLPQADSALSYMVYTGQVTEDFPELHKHTSTLPTSHPWVRVLWEQLIQPGLLRWNDVALAHGLAFSLPVGVSCPTVVTVYDLAFFRLPQYFRPWNRLYLKLITRISTKRAATVIAISHNTRQELIDILGVPPEKIVVVPPGRDPQFHPIKDWHKLEDFRRRRGLPDNMIFYLGTLEPRKNLVVLLQAYAKLRARDSSVPHLVLGGAKGWYYQDIFSTIKRLGLEKDVLLPGYIPGDELIWWYNAAGCFVYPSLYEGFGLPVLEAMACGTPVVTSNTASLPEVVGDAGLTVSPSDAGQLAEAMFTALRNPAWKEAAQQRGIRQASRFSWPKAAKQTTQVYRAMLEKGARE